MSEEPNLLCSTQLGGNRGTSGSGAAVSCDLGPVISSVNHLAKALNLGDYT